MQEGGERPKLVYVLWEFERSTDRHYFHLYEFLELLARDVDLVVVALGGDPPDIPGAKENVLLSRSGAAPSRYQRFPAPGLLQTLRFLWRTHRKGYRTFFMHYSFPVARRAALYTRIFGGRTYLWHSIMVDKLHEDVGASRLARPIIAATFRMVHAVVTSSRYMKVYYQKEFRLPPARVKVVRSSISLSRFDPARIDRDEARARLGYGPSDKVVLWVHGLERGKGALEIPLITSIVRASVPEAYFEIVGDGTRRPEIEAELARRQMLDRVRLRGRVANVDVLPYYRAADLFIMPSRFEEFSRVLLEAMAMGVPFVTSDGSGPIPDYLSKEQRDWVVPANRAAEFAKACVKLLQDNAARARLAAHGREYVQRYSLERARDEFFMEVLGANPPRTG